MGLQEVLVLLAHLVIVSSVMLFEDEPTEDHRKKVDTTHIYLPKVKLLTQQITLPEGVCNKTYSNDLLQALIIAPKIMKWTHFSFR